MCRTADLRTLNSHWWQSQFLFKHNSQYSLIFWQREIFQTKNMDRSWIKKAIAELNEDRARRDPLKRYQDWMPETVSIWGYILYICCIWRITFISHISENSANVCKSCSPRRDNWKVWAWCSQPHYRWQWKYISPHYLENPYWWSTIG